MNQIVFDVAGLTPFEQPDLRLFEALRRSGATAVLDLGRDRDHALSALETLDGERHAGSIIRLVTPVLSADEVPAAVETVILGEGLDVRDWADREVWAEATTVSAALEAAAAGASAIVAVGAEAAGRVGEETSFILLQRIVEQVDVPVWVRGGIGLNTVAACAAGGARGVLVDSQLALVKEASTSAEIRQAVAGMDGSEARTYGGYSIFHRPGLPSATLPEGIDAHQVEERLGGSLQENLVPVGQDGAFAKPLADRFHTAGGVIHALKQAAAEHVRLARQLEPLGADSPLSSSHGTHYPLAQGPMTRVSDTPAFAAEVARAGGLPFMALSMMRGRQVRSVVEETASLVGDRPWGVGILGFVPQELREEQLAALDGTPPPFALIAGGRPSQAHALEARGTKTYLHVPSPGLLDLFLKEGARRFVFEGRECGGHVGPRSSFALWEAQIERLLQDDDPGSLHVLFAGGIHDARSAAMVSAMTATLAARGAKIGALMGTAYLFTEEAVATGAIKERFQREAIACHQTVLLETAPGHATRCAETNYVRAFTERRQQLEAEGRSSKDVWAELEQLNLGRLRIASKGIVRDGDQLLEVSDEDQGRDGMYMLGQVASMRDATCTMAELHRDVCEGARGILAQADVSAPASATPAEQTDIAIVGMACMFPDAPDLAAFWRNIIEGRNSITEVDPERWDPAVYYDPEATGATAGEKTPSKWGGFLSPVALNPLDYGIPPKSLASIEPVQLLALDVARRALADAGYAEREFARERASVIFGAEAGTELSGAYGFRAMFPQVCGDMPDALDHALPDLSEDSFPGVLANVIAGRIANRLDLGGVNYTVDAACASSLAAVDLAVKELSGGTSDLVLCGGADLHNSINDFLLFSSVHALSPTGQCRTFSEDADGIALGEGVACVALKRLDDARRDGDRVYAVIKGIAGSSDGRSLGLTAPRAEGQKRALTRAYDRAGVSPAEVGLVEAHGTGTVVGDRTELSVLEDVYATAGAGPGHVTLGSVKSQIGHTKCAAGMAGLIKSALAIYTGTRPGTLNITAPNPAWDAEESPFAFGDGPRPWLSDSRKAALSALGFGGTNFHAVLSEADAETAGAVDAWPAELFVFRGETREDALEQIRRVRAYVQADPASRLRDIARTLATTSGPTQVAVVASDAGDLLDALDLAERFEAAPDRVFVSDPDLADGQLAFLFPGQGSQRPNMLADVFASFPYLKEWLRIGPGYADRIFPPAAFTSEERRAQRDALKDTRVAQPALGMVDTAMAQLVRSLGVEPDMLAGHSYGELAALSMAGAFDAETLVAISEARAACILDAAGEDPGTMAAVAAPAEAVRAALEGHDVVLANLNAPRQTVIAGTTEAIGRAVAHLEREGLAARSIPVACAFHSPLVSDAEHSFGQVLASRDIAAPVLPVWSNVTAGAYEPTAEAVRSGLSRQVAETVRWADQVLAMHEAGARVFVEVGPGQVLSGLVSKILGDRPHAVVPCDRSGAEPLRPFLGAVAQLAALGIPVDLSRLFEGRDANLVDLSTAPAGPAATAWWVDGHTARPVHGEAPAEALRPFDSPVPLSSPHVAESPAPPATTFTDPRDAAVIEYLRSMRELAAAQRDVVLGYLGTTAAAVPTVITTPTVVHTAVPTAARALPAPAPPTPAEPAVAAPVPEATPEPAASVDLEATLVGIVSERTGYPPEMLDLDLDLEAELSIDSIKRIEILGVLRETIDLTPPAGVSEDDVVEELAAKKTLRGILEWIESNTAARDNAPVLAEPSLVAGGDSTPSEPLPVLPLRRYAVRTRDAAPLGPADVEFAGRRFMVVDDGGGVADAVAALLTDRGASADVVAREDLSDSFDRADGLIDLDALAAGADASLAIRQFARARSALGGGAQIVILTSALGGRFGDDATDAVGGTSGLGRTLAREYPGALVRVVDLDPGAAPAETATALVAEMETLHGPTEVGIRDQHRVVRVVEEDPLDPAGDLDLTADSVVLLTGGARGITGRMAVEFARRFQCRLELVGRTPEPAGEPDADLADAGDAMAVRTALIARGMSDPGAIERACRRTLAEREIRETLRAIRDAGGTVTYHAVDVRDAEAFGALIDGVYDAYGRLDGIVHGAGILDDKLAKDKEIAAFDRVFGTKVDGALTITRHVRSDIRFIAFFGSVSGVFGNRGQSDYAAANALLDTLARRLDRQLDGRVVSLDWGPWAGGGMVSPELEREYARQGVGLIPPAEGIAALFDEIASGTEAQAVWMCATPEAMSPPDAQRALAPARSAV